MRLRYIKDRFFLVLVCVFSFVVSLPLLSIIYDVVSKGYRQISWEFFTEKTPSSWEAAMALAEGDIIPGGIATGIIGTLMIVLCASLLAIPIGILIGVYLWENPKSQYAGVIRFIADLLQGVPSIVVGLIAYSWVVRPMGSYSGLAAAVALVIMMLPMIIRSTEETLKMIPQSMREAALALGCSNTQAVFKVILPSAFGGIFTGILLSVSRVAGETAPLMLTVLGSSIISWDLTDPMSAIPLIIWEFYNDPNLVGMIWSCSIILLFLVLTLNIISNQIAKKWKIN